MGTSLASRVASAAGRRARDESGVAMIIAMVTLLIVSVLAIGAVTLSLTTNQGARQDTAQIDASEASQAGLQVALYRYNMLAPSSGNCVGDAVAAPGSNGVCTSSWVTMGNGSKYQYSTTPVMSSSGTCVGGVVQNTVNISNICITAVGMDNNQTSRTEIRAASFAGAPLFPYAGITALQGISETGGPTVNAAEATNGPITLTNVGSNAVPTSADLGPAGSYSTNNLQLTPPETHLTSPIVLSPVNPGSSATNNVDASIMTSGNNDNTESTTYVSYNPTTRALSTTGYAVITLTGGIYNFCSITSNGTLIVNVATGAKAVIYIDSPNDPGSNCPAGSGSMGTNTGGYTSWNNPSLNPTALQIYVYQAQTINFTASYNFYGLIYAPTSTVNLSGGINMSGAIAADAVTMSGGPTFSWASQAATLQAGTQGLYYRTAFGECGQMSSTAPTAGCS